MKITITLNSGKEITVETDKYNATEIKNEMNDQQITAINIGDVVLGKHTVTMIAPYVEPVVEESPVA